MQSVQDLNSCRRVHFLRRQPLHQHHLGFDIITIIICQFKSNQMEIILTGLNLTITGSGMSTAFNSINTYDDPEILDNCSERSMPMIFKSSIYTNL